MEVLFLIGLILNFCIALVASIFLSAHFEDKIRAKFRAAIAVLIHDSAKRIGINPDNVTVMLYEYKIRVYLKPLSEKDTHAFKQLVYIRWDSELFRNRLLVPLGLLYKAGKYLFELLTLLALLYFTLTLDSFLAAWLLIPTCFIVYIYDLVCCWLIYLATGRHVGESSNMYYYL